ncbi:50S ribosomal protein L1 [archaeon]|jgi:large subunit ribosomal protein L1|nr:50S ribosomal protein L1 [archaeon]MBT4351956.1 50S ribosomal protein L1 [archaeon]MBT4647406.1 50S ribosomal protein L1 [archaeon]MBT6821310.1 50S ribosomal protein L1 [archaeon]MBT7392862.1 50S ribosomal protein L1 [archaeon]
MEDKQIIDSLKGLKEGPKKKFKQTIDLIINLKNLDLKKPDEQVDTFLLLPRPKGKKTRVCALVGPELLDQAKKSMDSFVAQSDFENFQKNKGKAKNLAESADFFVAQANIMPKIATTFGRVFGPRGKMPNPKAGCIVAPNANLEAVNEKLQSTVRLLAKKQLIIQTIVGNEESPDEDVKENVKAIYNSLMHSLPQGNNNIKSVYLKYTMGKPVKLV